MSSKRKKTVGQYASSLYTELSISPNYEDELDLLTLMSPVNGRQLHFFYYPSVKHRYAAEGKDMFKMTFLRIISLNAETKEKILSYMDEPFDMRRLSVFSPPDFRWADNVADAINRFVIELGFVQGASLIQYETLSGEKDRKSVAIDIANGILNRVTAIKIPLIESFEKNCGILEAELDMLPCYFDHYPAIKDDIVVVLGSGVGALSMYMAAACDVKKVIGFEANEILANVADLALEDEFEKSCQWYGIHPSPIELIKEDFTDRKFRDLLTKEATIFVIHNIMFKEDLTNRMRNIISDIEPTENSRTVKIISAKPLCEGDSLMTNDKVFKTSNILGPYFTVHEVHMKKVQNVEKLVQEIEEEVKADRKRGMMDSPLSYAGRRFRVHKFRGYL